MTLKHNEAGTVVKVVQEEFDGWRVLLFDSYKFMHLLHSDLKDWREVVVSEGLVYELVAKVECKDCSDSESYFMNGSYDHYKCTFAGGEVCKYEEVA